MSNRLCPTLILPAALLICAAPAEPAAAQGVVQLNPQLQNNLRYLQIGISTGRVRASSSYSGRNFSSTSQTNDRQESLRVDMNGAAPSIDYQLTSTTQRLSVELSGGAHLKIRRSPVGGGVKAFLLDQPAEGKIVVTLGEPVEKRYEADSIWQLFIAEPELAQAELEPLLRLLRPGWPLITQAKAVEEALYKQVDALGKFDRDTWARLVDQLGSSQYVEREEADRKLRELGRSVVPYLKNLNPQRLDAEQMFRIRGISRRFDSQDNDEQPETAATWLAADPEVWYALARRATPAQRPLIRTQLERILGESIVLDAEADGDKLAAQLKTIRDLLDRRKAEAAK